MQIEPALRELRHFRDACGDGDAGNRMRAQIFDHAADEIAHVDQRVMRQIVEPAHGLFGCRAGGAGGMRQTRGARDVEPRWIE